MTNTAQLIAATDMEAVDDFLAHFGVAGMKWGKRKSVYDSAVTSLSSRYQGRAETKLEKNAGNKKVAIAKTVGRTAGNAVLIRAGSIGLKTAFGLVQSHSKKNRRIFNAGVNVADRLLQVANTANGAADVAAIARYKTR